MGCGLLLHLPGGNVWTYGERTVSLDFFYDLFGHDGIVVSYLDSLPMAAYQGTTVHDYYYFEDVDTPILLAQVYGDDTVILDLDGDGTPDYEMDDTVGKEGTELAFESYLRGTAGSGRWSGTPAARWSARAGGWTPPPARSCSRTAIC